MGHFRPRWRICRHSGPQQKGGRLDEQPESSYNVLHMGGIDEILGRISAKRPDQESAEPPLIRLDLVGTAEAAELLGIGRAAFSERRRRHENFPTPVSELRCGPVWFRWQIETYQAEETRGSEGVAGMADACTERTATVSEGPEI